MSQNTKNQCSREQELPLPTSPKKLYMVEMLRIWLILSIIFHHVVMRFPQEGKAVVSYLFGTPQHNSMSMGVECFFIIGGFFLYKRLMNQGTPPFEQVKKVWLRLAPGLIFVFALCCCFCKVQLAHLPTILLLAVGTGQAAPASHVHILEYGDWFLGVYFWITCLMIGIFQLPRRAAFLTLGVLMYAIFSLYLNNSKWVNNFAISARVGIIDAGMVRGLYSMGLGVICGFLSENIHLPQRWSAKLLGSAFEIWCLVSIFTFHSRPHLSQQNYWEALATMALLMISISQSWGYLSQILNKCAPVQYASRYVFPSLLGHIVMMKLLDTHQKFGMNFGQAAIFVIGGGIMLGIVEYHLVERYIVPKLVEFCHRCKTGEKK